MVEVGMMTRPEIGQDVDAMWEADAAAEWERLNAPDPYESKLIEAAGQLKEVSESLNKATDYLMEAQAELEGTPMEDVVGSAINDLEDVLCFVNELKDKYARGVR